MKNPIVKAWICVGIMLLGPVVILVSLAFLNTPVIMRLLWVAGGLIFVAGMYLHIRLVRCPHCNSYLGKVYGHRCPFCGEDFSKS